MSYFFCYTIIINVMRAFYYFAVLKKILLLDSSSVTDQSCTGLTGQSIFKNIFLEKLNGGNLMNGTWIRVEGKGFYERKYPKLQNKCYLIFSVENNGNAYQYQSAEMPLNTFDTTIISNRTPETFSFDFKLKKILDANDVLKIYLWNESEICYHLTSAKVLSIKLN